ncbi:RNA recognition motif domain-containing protein [Planctomycetota bacterium]
MTVKIYVGGLPLTINEDGLKALFAEFGEVAAVNMVKDGATGESRGFGFIEMPVREDAEKAIAEMAGKDIEGREISVEQARERVRSGSGRPRNGSGGRPGGGRGGPGSGGNRHQGGGGRR